MTKVIHDLQDSWMVYSYEQRYLDAFASVFAIDTEGPVAVIYYNDTFFLSYNRQKTSLLNEKVDKIKDCINIFLESNDLLICNKSKKNLLAFYISYNTDFKNHLSKCLSHYKDLHIDIMNIIKELRDLITFSYPQLNVKHQELSNSLFKSIDYEHHKLINLLLETTIIDCKKLVDESFNNIVDKYEYLLFDLYKKNMETSYIQKIGKVDTSLNAWLEKEGESLFMPIQNIEKLLYHLKFVKKIKNVNIDILSNTKSLHAEMNIVAEFPEFIMNYEFYVGVSRLCCLGCSHTLDKYIKNNHRGTHGKLYTNWNQPVKEKNYLKKELSKMTEKYKGNADSSEFKRLSIDNFEENLAISFYKENKLTLAELKVFLHLPNLELQIKNKILCILDDIQIDEEEKRKKLDWKGLDLKFDLSQHLGKLENDYTKKIAYQLCIAGAEITEKYLSLLFYDEYIGNINLSVAQLSNFLGMVYIKLAEDCYSKYICLIDKNNLITKGMHYLKGALDMFYKLSMGKSNREIIISLKNLSNANIKLGEESKGNSYMNEAIKLEINLPLVIQKSTLQNTISFNINDINEDLSDIFTS